MSKEEAFINSSESITGNIVKIISTQGIKAVYDGLNDEDKKIFQTAYSASYKPAKEILQEIYDEVSSGNEIRTVIMHGDRFDNILDQLAYTAVDNGASLNEELISDFVNHKVHQAVEECCKLRPAVDISLFAETSTKEIVIQ